MAVWKLDSLVGQLAGKNYISDIISRNPALSSRFIGTSIRFDNHQIFPYGYDVYFVVGNGREDKMIFPITTGEIKIENDSNNETVTLINEGEINIVKSPPLTTYEFEARFPMRDYPYSRSNSQYNGVGTKSDFKEYFDFFKNLKANKKKFQFKVLRPNWNTDETVTLEEFTITESTDNGDDVLIKFELKQAKSYGVQLLTEETQSSTSTTTKPRDDSNKPASTSSTYTVKKGDTLWSIAKKYYGKGSEWRKIYNANKNVVESTAKKYGKQSSSNGHWIYPKTTLTIPAK